MQQSQSVSFSSDAKSSQSSSSFGDNLTQEMEVILKYYDERRVADLRFIAHQENNVALSTLAKVCLGRMQPLQDRKSSSSLPSSTSRFGFGASGPGQ